MVPGHDRNCWNTKHIRGKPEGECDLVEVPSSYRQIHQLDQAEADRQVYAEEVRHAALGQSLEQPASLAAWEFFRRT